MQHTTFAVDLAKSVFEIAVSHRPGKVAERRRLSRKRLLRFFAQRQPATVLMEACGSSHHWARQIEACGHRVLILPPHRTRPYVTGNKTDRTDAKGLLEAHRNEQIRPVPIKSVDQQALAALHRLRSSWTAARTARINTIRGLLREFGFTIPLGANHVVPRLGLILADGDSELPAAVRPVLEEAGAEVVDLERRLRTVENQLRTLARQMPEVRKLRTIPGIGVITATALVAFVGDIGRFASGRHFASYLGLTPREHSSGMRRRLGSISKRGDVYLRTLLIHGARAVLRSAKLRERPDRLRAWALHVESRRGHNKAAVALANKIARIAWTVWRRDVDFVEKVAPVA
jgi:transposase